MALFGRRPRHVPQRLVPPEADQQHLPGRQSVQGQTGAYEGHGADIPRDVELVIMWLLR